MDHVELEPSLPFSPCDSDPPSFFNNAYNHEPDNQQNNLRRSGDDCISLDGVVAAVRRVDVSRTVENLSEDLISIGKYFDEIYTSIGLLRKNWLHYLVALGSGKDTIQDCLNSWDAIRKVRTSAYCFISLLKPKLFHDCKGVRWTFVAIKRTGG